MQIRGNAALLLAPFVMASALRAAEFSAQIVDGLNRPVAGVGFVVFCSPSAGTMDSFRLTSDQSGTVHAAYDASACSPLCVSIEKTGYQSYGTGVRPRYVLRRKFDLEDMSRVITLDGDDQRSYLRELVAGDFSTGERDFRDLVFRYESRLRPLLVVLVHEPKGTEHARQLLSLIGLPKDLELMVRLPSPPQEFAYGERWRYFVATALVHPETDEEWSFLRRCALGEFGDHWVDAGAIQSLQLSGSARAREILQEARTKNKHGASWIKTALKYLASNPTPLMSTNLEELAERVALVIGRDTWIHNGEPRFNEAGDKAIVDLTFQTSGDWLIDTATFYKEGATWSLRGVRETYQAFAPAPVPRVRKKQ